MSTEQRKADCKTQGGHGSVCVSRLSVCDSAYTEALLPEAVGII